MPNSRTARAVFDEEFLPIRAKLLEVAAALDRLDRAERFDRQGPTQNAGAGCDPSAAASGR